MYKISQPMKEQQRDSSSSISKMQRRTMEKCKSKKKLAQNGRSSSYRKSSARLEYVTHRAVEGDKQLGEQRPKEDNLSVISTSSNTSISTAVIYHDDAEAIGNTICRHCLRSQMELQLHYMRPQQRYKIQQHLARREKSKQREQGEQGEQQQQQQQQQQQYQHGRNNRRATRKRSKSHNKHIIQQNHQQQQQQQQQKQKQQQKQQQQQQQTQIQQQHKLPTLQIIQKLNAANEHAIRFRCPQVGPQVGHNRQVMIWPHFHHPQHLQQQQSAAYQLQYTQTYAHPTTRNFTKTSHLRSSPHTVIQFQQTYKSLSPQRAQFSETQTETILTFESEHEQKQLSTCYHQYRQQEKRQQKLLEEQQQELSNPCHLCKTKLAEIAKTVAMAKVKSSSDNINTTNNDKNCICLSSVSNHDTIARTTKTPTPTLTPTIAIPCHTCNLHYQQLQLQQHQPTYHHYPSNHHHYHHYHHHYHHHDQQQQQQQQQQQHEPQQPHIRSSHLTELETALSLRASTAQSLNTQQTTRNEQVEEEVEEEEVEAEVDGMATAITTALPDSPSLVKVRTWYTVAKQGVSC